MNYVKWFVIIILLSILIGCTGSDDGDIRKPAFKHFKVAVIQDNIEQSIMNNEVLLYKKKFEIVISFPRPDSILVNATFEPDAYTVAIEGQPLEVIPGFEGSGFPEEPFNSGETMVLSPTSPNYWYYANENDHRFTEVQKRPDSSILCKRSISYIDFPEDEEEKLPLGDLEESNIYLVFMKLRWNEDFSKRIEDKREVLKLTFRQ